MALTHTSPHFFPNQEVTGDRFFGRAMELQNIAHRITDNQSVLITGERRIGKSSLLKQARQKLQLVSSETEDHLIEAFFVHHLDDTLGPILHPTGPSRNTKLRHLLKHTDKRIRLFINDLDSIIAVQAEAEREGAAATIRGLVDSGHIVVAAVSYHPHLNLEAIS